MFECIEEALEEKLCRGVGERRINKANVNLVNFFNVLALFAVGTQKKIQIKHEKKSHCNATAAASERARKNRVIPFTVIKKVEEKRMNE